MDSTPQPTHAAVQPLPPGIVEAGNTPGLGGVSHFGGKEIKLDSDGYKLALQFRHSGMALSELKDTIFPLRSIVRIEDKNYGLVASWDGCPPDKIAIRFENDNVWFRPLEQCARVVDVKAAPRWVRQMKLRHFGKSVLRPIYRKAPLP